MLPQSAVRSLAPVPKLKFSAAKPPRYRPPPSCNGRRRFQASDWFTNISAAHAGLVHSRCNCKTEGQSMAVLQATRTKASGTTRSARLFVLELNAGRIHSMNPDGSDKKTIVTNCRLPDGIAVDVEAGHIYWTNMGVPNLNDGSIERADINGRIARSLFPKAPPTRRNRCTSIRRMANSIGA